MATQNIQTQSTKAAVVMARELLLNTVLPGLEGLSVPKQLRNEVVSGRAVVAASILGGVAELLSGEKNSAIEGQDFERAATLRDQEQILRSVEREMISAAGSVPHGKVLIGKKLRARIIEPVISVLANYGEARPDPEALAKSLTKRTWAPYSHRRSDLINYEDRGEITATQREELAWLEKLSDAYLANMPEKTVDVSPLNKALRGKK